MSKLLNLPSEWEDWKIERLIGEDSYVKLYLASKERGSKVYYSVIEYIFIPKNSDKGRTDYLSDDISDNLMSFINDEINVSSQLRGIENILSYNDYLIKETDFNDGYQIYIRMEHMRRLSEMIGQKGGFPEINIINLAIDMCSALEMLQQKNIIHGDIRPENIFVDDDGSYKLGNFGIKKVLDRTIGGSIARSTEVNTAPEVMKGSDESIGSEIYSLGLMIYRLLNNNRPPFAPQKGHPMTYNESNQALVRRMAGEKLPYPENCSSVDFSQIILRACEYNPENRWQNPSAMKKALISTLESDYKNKPNVPLNYEESEDKDSYEYIKDNTQNGYNSNYDSQSNEYNNTHAEQQPDYGYNNRQNTQTGRQSGGYPDSNVQNFDNYDVSQNSGNNSQYGYQDRYNNYNGGNTPNPPMPPSIETNHKKGKNKTMIIGISASAAVVLVILAVVLFVTPGLLRSDYNRPSSSNNSYSSKNTSDEDSYLDTEEKRTETERETEKETEKATEATVAKVTVPPVEELPVERAKDKLVENGLLYSVDFEYSDTVDEGSVMYQTPGEGERVEKGTVVELYVSLGPEETQLEYERKEHEQVIEVNTYGTQATLILREWDGREWVQLFETDNVYIGANGAGTNYGEGKSVTPMGTFDIGFCYGLNLPNTQLEFKRVTENSVFVDDPESEYYNMLVDKNALSGNVSYENTYKQFAESRYYSTCIFIEHNGDGKTVGSAEKYKGSVITICGINGELKPTLGCIDISSQDMAELLRYLDASKNPQITIY